jgi:hypothetical protein
MTVNGTGPRADAVPICRPAYRMDGPTHLGDRAAQLPSRMIRVTFDDREYPAGRHNRVSV